MTYFEYTKIVVIIKTNFQNGTVILLHFFWKCCQSIKSFTQYFMPASAISMILTSYFRSRLQALLCLSCFDLSYFRTRFHHPSSPCNALKCLSVAHNVSFDVYVPFYCLFCLCTLLSLNLFIYAYVVCISMLFLCKKTAALGH